MADLFESKQGYFSKKGNSGSMRTGWEKSKLGKKKKEIILKALDDSHIDKVFRDSKKKNQIFALVLNGLTVRLA